MIPVFALPADVAGPGLAVAAFSLYIGALIMYFLVIVVVESAVLQFIAWDSFRRCLRGSFWMNLASTLVGFFFLAMIPAWGLWGIAIAMLLSIVIEGLVLMRLKSGENQRNWKAALAANLVSYLILILPVYYYVNQQL